MNVRMIQISSLLLIASFVNCAKRETINMSRIYAAKEQVEKNYAQAIDERNIAQEKLYVTKEGKIYKRTKDIYNNFWISHHLVYPNCPELVQASENLRATEEYNELLSLKKKLCIMSGN